MTIEEIFTKLASHMKEGLEYHDLFAQAYHFIGLRGYAVSQEHHFLEESQSYKLLLRYYAKHYHKLIILENFDKPKIIPETWYKYTTMAVDTNTKRNAVKDLMTKWIDWERSTKKLY
jgi:negative regulator of replication initiation